MHSEILRRTGSIGRRTATGCASRSITISVCTGRRMDRMSFVKSASLMCSAGGSILKIPNNDLLILVNRPNASDATFHGVLVSLQSLPHAGKRGPGGRQSDSELQYVQSSASEVPEHRRTKNLVQTGMITLALGLQPGQHVRVDAHSQLAFNGSVQTATYRIRPETSRSRRNVAVIDLLVRHLSQRREFRPSA